MLPENLRYTKEHEWVSIEEETALVGITEYACSQLGDIVFVELPPQEAKIEISKTFGVVESVKAVSDLYAPLSGEVIHVNKNLEEHPELINEDPYGEGWMIKIKIKDLNELNKLLNFEEYQKLINQE
ncbi:MAG: glycine cleavage system protein GcvH [Armatimonadetes bacterium]|nr:glycine cleavage system protein GcvH [Armatimonadota bacterium]